MAKFFITGGSGFIGSVISKELISQGHKVSSLARSTESAAKIKSIDSSIEIVHGSLEDYNVIKKAASESDGVFHLGFIHDFAKLDHVTTVDRTIVETVGEALEGTNKPFVYTSTITPYSTQLAKGEKVTEDIKIDYSKIRFGLERTKNEKLALSLAAKGIRSSTIRLPCVHGSDDPNFFRIYKTVSQKMGFVGLPDHVEGNVWSSIQKDDAANLFIEAALNGKAGSIYHGVDEEGVALTDIAQAIADSLQLPVKRVPMSELSAAYGFLANFLVADIPASSYKTQAELNWKATGPSLLEDLRTVY